MQQLTAIELRDLCRGDEPRPLLLDVRESWEVSLAPLRAEGATTRHIPMNQIPTQIAELPAARPIVCFCHHGVRSAQVVAFLMRSGLQDVYNLAGGIDTWSVDVDPGVARY